jgi:hypothetical protein
MLQQMWRESGKKPAALASQPRLLDQDKYYFRVFSSLNSSRAVGDALGAIPESEYLAYFENRGIPPGDEREHTIAIVRRMDVAFLAAMNKKRKERMDRMEKEAKQRRR